MKTKRIGACLISVMLVLSLFPVAAWAEAGKIPESGEAIEIEETLETEEPSQSGEALEAEEDLETEESSESGEALETDEVLEMEESAETERSSFRGSGGGAGTTFVSVEYQLFENAARIALNQAVTVNVANIIDGEYCRDAYINRFQIVLPEDGYINGVNDCDLEIYAPDEADDPIASLGSWNLGLAAGTYYVKGYFHYNESKTFTIHYVETDDWEKEPNPEPARATPVLENKPVNGWLMDWDSDWYQIILPEAGLVSFGLTYNNEQTDPDKYWFVELSDGVIGDGTFSDQEPQLLAGKGGNVAEDSDRLKTILVENVGLSPGTYYLRVGAVSNYGAQDWNYQVFWSYTPSFLCETERNDSYETADILPLNQAFFATRTFAQPMHSQRNDDDYFAVVLDSPGALSFSVTPKEDGEFSFELSNSEQEYVYEFAFQGEQGKTFSSKKLGLAAGTYYLDACRVAENDPYLLTANFEASDFWEKEPNDEYPLATEIVPGSSVRGRLEGGWGGSGNDCYTFTLTQPGYINTGMAYQYHEDEDNQDRDFLLSLHDETERELFCAGGDCGADSDTKDGFSMNRIGLPAGTYYLVVWTNTVSDSVDNYYDLWLDFTAADNYETEWNDDFESADLIELDKEYGAQNMGGDCDCFAFTVHGDEQIAVSLSSEAEGFYQFDLCTQEEDVLEQLVFDPAPAGTEAVSDPAALSAGNYYLRVYAPERVPFFFRIRHLNHVHTPEILKAVEPTCTETGLTEGKICSECKEVLLAQTIVPAKGHKEVSIPAAAPTCTAAGRTKGSKCSVCGRVLTEQATIPALGHTYKNVIIKATLSKDGSITPTCTVCSAKSGATVIKKIKTVSLSAASYTYNGKIRKPAVTVRDSAGKAISAKDYTAAYSNSKSTAAGSYKVTVSFRGNYSGKKELAYKINPAANPLTVKPVSKTYRQAALKKSTAFTISAAKAQGKVTYTLAPAAKKAGIKVTNAGKVTIPKNCKSGTFKITVKAAGNKNYKAVTKTVTVTVR